jgi:hypothetical protein
MITKNSILALPLALLAMCSNNNDAPLQFGTEANEAVSMDSKLVSSAPDQTTVSLTERKLIKNGDLSFETSDVKKTKASVETICKELNAYISNESQNNYGERLQYNQMIRVPADQFDLLLQKLEGEAVKIESKNIHTQDVTEEFIDVEARLKTKKELETRYREILKQAKTVQDIVTIEGQIAAVRSEIESMEGRLTYLKNQVAFSTLNVSYYEIIGTDFGFANKFVRGLGQGWDNLLSFLIVLTNLWPFFILVVAIAWGVARWQKRKRDQSMHP